MLRNDEWQLRVGLTLRPTVRKLYYIYLTKTTGIQNVQMDVHVKVTTNMVLCLNIKHIV